MSQALLEAAQAAIARGFRIFPLDPGTKHPAIKKWQKLATSDPALVEKVWGAGDFNIGVLCDGMIVVDADCKDGRPGLADRLALNLPPTYTVQTPTGGLHDYFTGPDVRNVGASDTHHPLGRGIDVRGKGGFVVGAGSVIGGERYNTLASRPIVAAPGELCQRLQTPARAVSPSLPVDTDGEASVAAAVAYLEAAAPAVEGQGGDHQTFTVAAFLRDFGVSEATAVELMVEHWNDRCSPPWELEGIEDKVRNAFRYGENSQGSKHPTNWFVGIDIPPLPVKQTSSLRVNYYTPGGPFQDDPWLFYKILPASGVAVLVGPSGAGKSFLLNKLAVCLAANEPFLGTPPDDPGGTIFLYAGTEGSGFDKRMAALVGDRVLPVGQTYVAGLRERGALDALCTCLQEEAAHMREVFGVPLRLVVLETLSASGLIEDENNAAMVSSAMAALAVLGRRLGLLVVVSHHPPKEGKGSRGSGSITNSADYVIEVHREPGHKVREIELTKARSAEERSLGSFTLVPVVLGQDSRGRPIDTMVVSTGDPVTPQARKAAHADKFIEAVEMVLSPLGDADFDETRQSFYALVRATGDKSKLFKTAYEYALTMAMVELVTVDGRQIFRKRSL